MRRGKLKRGSHVGVVLSFVVFVTFLLFLYTVLEPSLKTQRSKSQELERLGDNLLETFLGSVRVATITNEVVEDTEGINCLKISKEGLAENEEKSVVKNLNGNIIGSKIDGQIKVEWDGSDGGVFKLYLSNESLEKSPFEPAECANGKILLVQERKYVFYDRVNETFFRYNESYEELKSDLGVSSQNEFSFSFVYKNGERIDTPEKTKGKNIFSKEIPIQYMNKTADVLQGFVYVTIW